MKNFPTHLRIAIIIAALLMPVCAKAQNQPDPLDEERKKIQAAYAAELEAMNQSAVDAKNAEAAAVQTKAAADAAAAVPKMPTLTAPATTTSNGTIVMTFTDGALLPADLSGLWAKVTYNGTTYYWKLDPSMLSEDGKTFTMQFGPSFANVTFQWQLYGFTADGTKTDNSNIVTFKVNAPGTVTMPATTAPATTTTGGTINITFAQSVLPETLSELWAKVAYNGKTEYWKLDPGMISADGKTFTMQFDPAFDGTTMTMTLFGKAASDKSETNYSNAVSFTIRSSGTVTIPAITAPDKTDLNSTISIGLATAVLPASLSQLWAIVTIDGQAQYWQLDPSMISADGKTFTMTFDDVYAGKKIGLQLYGVAASDSSKTNISNQVTFTVIAAESTVTIPAISASVTADVNGKAVIYFTSGTLLASQLNQLWVQVTYNNDAGAAVTEYWNVGTGALNSTGTALTLEFAPKFKGKTVAVKMYAFDINDIQTGFSNAASITIPAATASVTMPTLPASVTADVNGNAVVAFSSGTVLASQLNQLWARVTYDKNGVSTTEYWNIGTGALAADGKSITLQFASSFEGKTVALSIYGFDTNGVQTDFSNNVSVVIPTSSTTPTMPTLPATVTATVNGNATITFSSGSITASQLSGLWAEVIYDKNGVSTTEYWNIGTGALNSTGTAVNLEFTSAFQGKTVAVRIYGFDTQNKQTAFSNTVNVIVPAATASVTMPTLPATVTADVNDKAVIAFSSGTVLASQLNQLWAKVTYDKAGVSTTEYWNIGTGALAADGKSITLQFASSFEGKTVALSIYGFDTNGVQTGFSNNVSVVIPTSSTTPTMPTLPATVTATTSGTAVINFASGTITASQLSGLWAEVTYDKSGVSTTEYWNIGTGALNSTGTAINLAFTSAFQGKTVAVRIYGFDTQNKQTAFSNTVNVIVPTIQSSIVMPVVPSYVTTNASGTAAITFTSGTLQPSLLNEFWVEVTYNNDVGTSVTEYWNISTDALNSTGTTVTLQFIHAFNGKTVRLRFFGKDTNGLETLFTNPVIIQSVTS